MIAALSAAATIAVVAVLAAVEWTRPNRNRLPRRDPHWGDWPPDQMAQ